MSNVKDFELEKLARSTPVVETMQLANKITADFVRGMTLINQLKSESAGSIDGYEFHITYEITKLGES